MYKYFSRCRECYENPCHFPQVPAPPPALRFASGKPAAVAFIILLITTLTPYKIVLTFHQSLSAKVTQRNSNDNEFCLY